MADEPIKKDEELAPEQTPSNISAETPSEAETAAVHEQTPSPEGSLDPSTNPSQGSASTTPAPESNATQMIGLALVVAGVIVIGALFMTGVVSLPGSSDNAATPLAGMSADDPVAIVNGERIPKSLYDQQYQQTEAVLSSMGGTEQLGDPAFEAELRESLINDLVNAELLFQAAIAAGVSVSDEEIQNEYTSTEEQVGGPDELATQLAAIGLNEGSLRELIRRQMTIEQHLNDELDYQNIEVSDADVQAFYDEFVVAGAPEGADLPPLEDIRPQIESQIAQDRSAELIDGYIAQLRANADIQVLI